MRTIGWLAFVGVVVGCGSGAGSLSGSVSGRSIDVHDAVFMENEFHGVLLVATDLENLCSILDGADSLPTKPFVLLESQLANYNGSEWVPLAPGDYVPPGNRPLSSGIKYELTTFWEEDGCATWTDPNHSFQPSSDGTLTVSTYDGPRAGGHLKAKVNLMFGADALRGELNASYCDLSDGGPVCASSRSGEDSSTPR